MDWDAFAKPLENACHRVPAITEAGIRSTVCGPGKYDVMGGVLSLNHYEISQKTY